MQAHVHTLATRQRSYCSRQRVCNRRQHRGNRRPFRLKGRTRGAPAYCSQVSTFGYYRWPLTKTSPARSWHRTNRLTGHAATACPRASSSRKAGLTPATTLSARICIRPVLSPFLYFPYAGLTTLLYPILGYFSLLYTHCVVGTVVQRHQKRDEVSTHLFFGVARLRFLRPLCAAFSYRATASQ